MTSTSRSKGLHAGPSPDVATGNRCAWAIAMWAVDNHADDERVERYSRGLLPEGELGKWEEHLLICSRCRLLLENTDEFIKVMRAAAAKNEAQERLERRIRSGEFDVFLSHNGSTKPAVKRIGNRLRRRGILPWLDELELRPGLPWQHVLQEQLPKISAAAVLVGSDGIGPWQHHEIDALLQLFVERQCPVIPVLLPDAVDVPSLPPFLRNFTWVDFRKRTPKPIDQLIWGITGERVARLS